MSPELCLIGAFSSVKRIEDKNMRELNCVVMPNSEGWCLRVRDHLHGRFASKGEALRAAIVEAEKGRAAGFYSLVTVQHGTKLDL